VYGFMPAKGACYSHFCSHILTHSHSHSLTHTLTLTFTHTHSHTLTLSHTLAAAMFDDKCEPIKDFGSGPRNTVQFSPHGNVLAIAGFGNLRGEIEFWARDDKAKGAAPGSGEYKLLNKLHASDSTLFEWCPDSRHIITATTSPRLKVDNG
jgi:uncharacterized protein with WD repeat